MENSLDTPSNTTKYDLNNPSFYENIQAEIEQYQALMKRNVDDMIDLRYTDYQSRFRYDYPTVYIPPGQKEAYQTLYCINPPTVNKALTVVCDWVAPPQVQFTLGDEYMRVVRQDPTGRYQGNAVITTQQLCQHNRTVHELMPVPIAITELTENDI